MNKIFNILFLQIFLCIGIISQSNSLKPVFYNKDFGKFLITTNDSIFVNFKVGAFIYPEKSEYTDSTDYSFSIVSPQNEVLYKEVICTDFDYLGLHWITPFVINIPLIGNVLAVHINYIPSSGSYNGTLQLFGLDKYGILVPLTGKLDYLNLKSEDIRWLDENSHMLKFDKLNSKDLNIYKPYIEDESFLCNGFSYFVYYPIYRNGICNELYYKKFDSEFMPVKYGLNNFMTINKLNNDYRDTIVLYNSADFRSKQKKILLKKGSILKFIEMKWDETLESVLIFWIHLRIDGYDGYIDSKEANKIGIQDEQE